MKQDVINLPTVRIKHDNSRFKIAYRYIGNLLQVDFIIMRWENIIGYLSQV